MRRLARYSLCLACAVTLAACSLAGDDDGTVTASATPPTLTVTNQTENTVYTFVVGREAAAQINWSPDVKGDGLPPGEQRRIRYADIFKSASEEEAIVYWWTAVTHDGERVPGSLHTIVVAL